MPNAVYLFRLYCEPTRDMVPGVYPTWLSDSVDEFYPFDSNTIDQVVSLPDDTADLVTQANTLVQAYSTLCVINTIYFVAVFRLDADKPADHNTPVMVLHPFYMQIQQPPFLIDGLTNNTRWDTIWALPRIVEYGSGRSWAMRGFDSYGLISNNGENNSNNQWPHDFYVLNLARASNIGRISNHFVSRAIDPQDYMYSLKSTLKLRTNTPLWRLRWPLFRQIMNRLAYQHTGYHLQGDGSVKLGRISEGDYIPAGVTYMAKQRKRFKRRTRATSKVCSQWWRTVTRLMQVLRHIENYGYSEGRLAYTVYPAGTKLFATGVQHEFLKKNLYTLTEFLNVVGVATGNNSLLLTMPDTTPDSREADFGSIVEFLTNEDGTLSQYSVKGKTQNVHVFQVIHQLTANLIRQINDFQNAVNAFYAFPTPTDISARPGHGMILVNLYQLFALKWPAMQADLIKILSLLLTWHLTFEPVEKTGAAPGEPQIPGLVRRALPKWITDVYALPAPPITSWPDVVNSRFAYDLPDFAPFRVWDVDLVETNGQQAVIDEIARQDKEALEAFRLYNKTQDEAAAADRRYRRELEMQQIVADYDSDIPPWVSLQPGYEATQAYETYWYNRFATPMNGELRERALIVTDTRLRFQLENKRRMSPGEVYQHQYPGAPAEFVTNAPPPDIVLPFCTYTRWIKRRIGSATVNAKQVWTANGVEDYANEMRFHVPQYQDVAHFEFSDIWALDYTL